MVILRVLTLFDILLLIACLWRTLKDGMNILPDKCLAKTLPPPSKTRRLSLKSSMINLYGKQKRMGSTRFGVHIVFVLMSYLTLPTSGVRDIGQEFGV